MPKPAVFVRLPTKKMKADIVRAAKAAGWSEAQWVLSLIEEKLSAVESRPSSPPVPQIVANDSQAGAA